MAHSVLNRIVTSRIGFQTSKHFGQRWSSTFPSIQGLGTPIAARPSLGSIVCLIYSGSTIPLDRPGLNMKEFFSGGCYAINRTSEILSSESIENHSDLFDKEIHQKLKSQISELDEEMRKKLLLDIDDIFFAWIDGIQDSEQSTKIKFVTMSFPKYKQMKDNIHEKSAIEDQLKEKVRELMSQNQDINLIRQKLNSPQVKGLNQQRADMYNSGEIIITNVDFHRTSESSPWIIQDFKMAESPSVHTSLGSALWKFRLRVAIESKRDFQVFMRLDYFTNFLILLSFVIVSWATPNL